jgi:phage baseplate assembly protein W
MDGINATTGKRLGGIAHLRQSITDLLNTRQGSRVMTRTYGCRLFDLIDAPMNQATIADIRAAVAECLAGVNPRTGQTWEPRFRLEKVSVVTASPGRVEFDLIGEYLPDGQVVTLDGIKVQ